MSPRRRRRPDAGDDWRFDSAAERVRAKVRLAVAVVLLVILGAALFGGAIRTALRPLTEAVDQVRQAEASGVPRETTTR